MSGDCGSWLSSVSSIMVVIGPRIPTAPPSSQKESGKARHETGQWGINYFRLAMMTSMASRLYKYSSRFSSVKSGPFRDFRI